MMNIFMPSVPRPNPNIKKENLLALAIILDYLRGHSIPDIKIRLKNQSIKLDMDCKDRYQNIKPKNNADARLNELNKLILDELSIDGCSLHLMPINKANESNHTNCYIWTGTELFYISANNTNTSLQLTTTEAQFAEMVAGLKSKSTQSTIHLSATKIGELITRGTQDSHAPPTTNQRSDYENSENLYVALKSLQVNHPHLTLLLELIDETRVERPGWLYLMYAAGLTALTGILIYMKEHSELVEAWFEKIIPIVARWLGNTVYLLRSTPLLGIISNGFQLINFWYHTLVYGTYNDQNKITRLFFKTLEYGLPIIGYVLCYLAGGVMTLPALSMLITGSVIDIIETLYTRNNHVYERQKNPSPNATDYYSATQKARADNFHERNLFIFLVTLTAHILTTVSVIVWCVFPPSLMIAVPCMVFTYLVSQTKDSCLAYFKNRFDNQLQTELENIFTIYQPEREVYASKHKQITTELNHIFTHDPKEHNNKSGHQFRFFTNRSGSSKEASLANSNANVYNNSDSSKNKLSLEDQHRGQYNP